MDWKTIKIHTNQMFYDITDEVAKAAEFVKEGLIIVYSPHTTSMIKIMENEPRLLKDIERWLEDIVPRSNHYDHDDIEHRPVPDHERMNAYSHLRSFFGNSSETIPVEDGKLLIGQWQKVMLIELDIGRDREIKVYGVAKFK